MSVRVQRISYVVRGMNIDMKKFKAFNTVRQARAVARLWGIRAKKARDAEADDVSKPGKK